MKKLTLLLLLSFPTAYAMEANLPWTFEELQKQHADFDLISYKTQNKIIEKLSRKFLSKEFWTDKYGTLLAYAMLKHSDLFKNHLIDITPDDTPEGIYTFKQLSLKSNIYPSINVDKHNDGYLILTWYRNITQEMTLEEATNKYNELVAQKEKEKQAELYYTQEFLSSESDNSDDDSGNSEDQLDTATNQNDPVGYDFWRGK